jgi:hypothetical protein
MRSHFKTIELLIQFTLHEISILEKVKSVLKINMAITNCFHDADDLGQRKTVTSMNLELNRENIIHGVITKPIECNSNE